MDLALVPTLASPDIATEPSSASPSTASIGSDAAVTSGAVGAGFTEALARQLDSVESAAGAANAAVEKMLTGQGDVHDAMIALQRAEMTLQLTVQIRNRLVQAYQEIMRMPV